MFGIGTGEDYYQICKYYDFNERRIIFSEIIHIQGAEDFSKFLLMGPFENWRNHDT